MIGFNHDWGLYPSPQDPPKEKNEFFADILYVHHIDGNPHNSDLGNLTFVRIRENRMATKTDPKPRVKLVNRDGNAFAILGACTTAARKAKWPPEKIKEFTGKAMSGDYDHLLRTCMEYFDVH